MTQPPSPSPRSRSAAERVLAVFADVHRGEGGTALLTALAGFLLLLAYYLVKVAREPLIVGAGDDGAEWKTYAAGGQAILLVGVLALYDWIYARVSRMRLLTLSYGFFALNLLIFYALASGLGVDHAPPPGAEASVAAAVIGIGFYLWVGIFSVFVIAQFWSFANDIYTAEQGSRLFGFIAIGGTVGAATGSTIAKQVIVLFGSELPVMLLGAAVLLVTLGLLAVISRREASALARRDAAAAADSTPGAPARPASEGGFKLVIGDRYLLYMALLILILNLVNTTGEYILDRYLKVAAEAAFASQGVDERTFIGAFRGDFFTIVNVVVVALQALVVSRFLQYRGVRVALFVLPIVALLGYVSLALIPVLLVVKVSKIAENSVDYSLQNTAQQALWLGTSRDQKYKAKAVIDTFFKRGGDVLSALLVLLGSASLLAFDIATFIVINIAFVALWLLVTVRLTRLHRAREAALDAGGTS
ncbi:MAG: translocase [Deltaproteobacteria bacterium HGW-Deltaproteobacteria-14]|jgi:AAA family ATP:ADP antiporter|nr:MAG: translocase [Deltaproteobacteria bacterium HGW-Deltaproteobacteria-14]